MSDRLSNVELLIMLSEDICGQGDELSKEMFERGQTHARRVLEMSKMLDKARGMLDREMHRYGHYIQEKRGDSLPRTESLPRVVSKGPAQATG
jgi:hypothetical protein